MLTLWRLVNKIYRNRLCTEHLGTFICDCMVLGCLVTSHVTKFTKSLNHGHRALHNWAICQRRSFRFAECLWNGNVRRAVNLYQNLHQTRSRIYRGTRKLLRKAFWYLPLGKVQVWVWHDQIMIGRESQPKIITTLEDQQLWGPLRTFEDLWGLKFAKTNSWLSDLVVSNQCLTGHHSGVVQQTLTPDTQLWEGSVRGLCQESGSSIRTIFSPITGEPALR